MSPFTSPIPESDLIAAKEIVRPNLVKNLMEQGKLAHSFGLRLCFSTEIPLIAKRSGYSAILMNLEHMAMGMESMSQVCVASMNVGITPMVVVPTVAAEWISRCLDSGAQCVIVPHVNNVEEAKLCVNASKFAPVGHRSLTMVTAMTQYAAMGLSYRAVGEVVNENIMIMPMIETVDGVKNVEEIAAVPGIDCLLVGCADLCMELGIPQEYESEHFHNTIAKISAAAEKASTSEKKVFVGLGGLEPYPKILEMLLQRHSNIRFVMATRDVSVLMAGMKANAGSMNALSDKLQ